MLLAVLSVNGALGPSGAAYALGVRAGSGAAEAQAGATSCHDGAQHRADFASPDRPLPPCCADDGCQCIGTASLGPPARPAALSIGRSPLRATASATAIVGADPPPLLRPPIA